MTIADPVEKCLSFLRSQMQSSAQTGTGAPPPVSKLAITISRQTGTGGLAIAQRLAQCLDQVRPTPGAAWTVFDKNLVEEVLKRHNLPEELGRFMDEERTSELQAMIEEVLGLHPSSWELVRHVSETILHLADVGGVILVGRGANVITARLKHVFHVRIVGTLERRVQRLCHFERVSAERARALIEQSDQARRRYLRRYFRRDIDDPLLYDLVVNTDRLTDAEATRIIAEAALTRCTA